MDNIENDVNAGADEYVSPFDDAAANAAPIETDDAEPIAFGERPAKRKRGRKASRATGAKRGRPKKNTSRADTSPPPDRIATSQPSAPAPSNGAVAAIPSAQLVPLIKRLDALIASRLGTDPLTAGELEEGAAVLAPVLHHYMPSMLSSSQPWVPAALWVALTYGPRALERATAPVPAQREPTEAHPASSVANFSGAPTIARPVVVETRDTPAPTPRVWINPLDDGSGDGDAAR